VTAFDAHNTGTPESAWSQCAWLREAPELPAPSAARLVVLAAHPDDETLGAGGLIARAADAGVEVYVIVASDGAASHPHSPTHRPAELARVRAAEVTAAVRALAPEATVEFLGLPDGGLASRVEEITGAIRAAAWDVSVVVAPWAYDRHPDHEACAQAAREAAAHAEWIELWEYPIWAWHWGSPATALASLDPQATGTRRLSLDDAIRARKRKAVAAYTSQVQPLSSAAGDEPVLAPETLEYFARDCECFFLIDPHPVGAR
jgi:LmbE family N-acetylglucosaminyl deacetylase